jgi:hypothetical protein
VVGVVAKIVLGLALLALAGVFVMAGLRDWRLWTVVRRLAPATPDQLVEAARAGRLKRELVAVTGVARAGRAGPLVSTINGQDCVWHRHTVHRRRVRRRADGRTRQSLRRKRVADVSSNESVILVGTSVGVEVAPLDIQVDRPTRAGVRYLPSRVTQSFPDAAGLMGNELYVHREWIVQSGTPLYVLAEATATGGRVVIRRPGKGPSVMSTRPVAGLRRSRLTSALIAFTLTLTCIVAGLAFLILL